MISVHCRSDTCPNSGRTRLGLRGFLALVRQAIAARSQRKHLTTLEPRLLKDIGLTPRMAEDEATRPLWDVPNNWKR